MKILTKQSKENFDDMVANECQDKCVRMCLIDIQVTKSQSIMETQSGNHGCP